MAWNVLRTLMCWEKYQQQTAQSLGIVGVPVNWGSGPASYPCLVCTYMPPAVPARLVSAYVYVSDAEELFKAAGRLGDLVVSQPGEMPRPAQAQTQVSGQQDNFNRWVSAYLLALTRELREISALKPEPFERSLVESLQLVDEVTTERRDEALARLDGTDKAIIDRLRNKE